MLTSDGNAKTLFPVSELTCILSLIHKNGDPLTNPHAAPGQELVVFALPAPEIWKTKRGLEVFGPRSFGFDFDYVSVVGE